ncbi:hypothetical protein LHYA1_G007792 [Lachnellula hyalina]|uniref:GPI mannosyltransferase 2 subunit PGA1 n=1 Tax=Lachnellula hyalina TaxID=1316788 RepID=A0A8H8QWU0_9HELO|nr:uncharacterized protein LHYA1_G007792 [Lachnellula hyalina]TVY23175.1 hypothetical protein LHYA1_G007792 [Lachnellula hyalina]
MHSPVMWHFLPLLLQVCTVFANTEKVIFLGPSSLQVPVEHPTLEDLDLEPLSPQHWTLRTHIRAEFPTDSLKHGQASWYLLHRLEEGRRYEVRICWAATQPTSFRLETYDLPTVFENPELITSLAQYSEGRQSEPTQIADEKPSISRKPTAERDANDLSSTLFLQVFAAADYYTTNKTIMNNVPPVFVDIILDPFIFNVFPRSLLPTAAYIVLLAIGGWYLSKYVGSWFENLAKQDANEEKKKI